MPAGRFISYIRVSTAGQDRSGLGQEAQRLAVRTYLNGGCWHLLAEFEEVESGRNNERPQLAAALAECRLTGSTLVIAKLDRLSRDAAFLMGLERAGVDFVAADMPNANRLTVGVMALVAEQEAKAIGQRTREALAAAKARGVKLGGVRQNHRPVDGAAGVAAVAEKTAAYRATVRPIAEQLQASGLSLRNIAAALEARNVRTPRGGAWTAKAVMAVLG